MHSIYIQYTSHKQIIKSRGSFSEHYFYFKDKYVPSPKKYKRQITPLLYYKDHNDQQLHNGRLEGGRYEEIRL